MKDMNDIVDQLVNDIEDIPEDTSVVYEVWAIGHDEEDCLTGAELLLATFEDPDPAVEYAKAVSLADVVNLAADDNCEVTATAHSISIEVETVVPDDFGNVGTVYRKRIEIFEELPEFVALSNNEFEIMEDGNIRIPCILLRDYKKNDNITVIFEDEEKPWPITYKIISKTTDGYYICEFV